MLASAIPFAISYFAIWVTFDAASGVKFVYYLGIVLIYNTFSQAISVPYSALTAELAGNYHEAGLLTVREFVCGSCLYCFLDE